MKFNDMDDLNLWMGADYRPGGILICLRNTYKYSTRECVQRFYDREWFDNSLLKLVDGVICQRGQSREQAMAPLAITNFVERILADASTPPNRDDYEKSKEPFRQRLRRLQPGVALLGGNDVQKWAGPIVAQFPQITPVPCIHPSYVLTDEPFEQLCRDWARALQQSQSISYERTL